MAVSAHVEVDGSDSWAEALEPLQPVNVVAASHGLSPALPMEVIRNASQGLIRQTVHGQGAQP